MLPPTGTIFGPELEGADPVCAVRQGHVSHPWETEASGRPLAQARFEASSLLSGPRGGRVCVLCWPARSAVCALRGSAPRGPGVCTSSPLSRAVCCFGLGASMWIPDSACPSLGRAPAGLGRCASVVSDCMQPYRRQPTRLPGPWDSPGKNAGVGCHFLLQTYVQLRFFSFLIRSEDE